MGSFIHVYPDFVGKKNGGKYRISLTVFLVGHCNYSFSSCFNQFHSILYRFDYGIFIMKYMEYWNGSTLVEAIDVVINFNKSIFFSNTSFQNKY